MFAPGGCDETGIDAAVVKISKRQPTDGAFIWVSPESQAAAGNDYLFCRSLLMSLIWKIHFKEERSAILTAFIY